MFFFGTWYLLATIGVLSIYLIPLAKVLSRAGWNPWLVLLWLVPVLNIAMMWAFAYGDWPALRDRFDRVS